MTSWRSAPLTLILLVLTCVVLALAVFGWRRRPAPGAFPFTILMLAVAHWLFGYAWELGVDDVATKLWWAQWEYLGIVIVPVAWLLFAWQVDNRTEQLPKRLTGLLLIVPLLMVIMVWTNAAHGLVWQQATLSEGQLFTALDVTYGPFFWLFLAYSEILILIGTLLLLRMLLHTPELYRRQILAILFGAITPWVGNALYIFDIGPIPDLDLGPFAFVATGIAFAWSLFHLQLLQVGPIARNAIMEGMRDGVIVLDRQHRIVDFNPAAQQFVGTSLRSAIGHNVQEILPPVVASYVSSPAPADSMQITLLAGGEDRTYEISSSVVLGRKNRLAGTLLVFRDITLRVQAQTALRQSEERYRIVSELTSDYAFAFNLSPDNKLSLEWVTDAFVRITGFSGQEVKERGGWLSLVHPDDKHYAQTTVQPTLSGNPTVGEFRIITKAGQLRWLRSYNRPVWDATQQRVVRILGAGQDITERKHAEDALRQQNEYLAALHETSLAVVNRLEVNDVLEEIVTRAGALVGSEHGYVYLIEPDTNDLVVHIGLGYFSNRRGYRIRQVETHGLASVVRQTGQPLAIDDYRTWNKRRADLGDEPFRAIAAIPLTSRDAVVGVLGVAYMEDGRVFGDHEIAILSRFAQLASIALDNARLYTTAQREIAERKRAEADLALARDQALEAAQLKTDFLATMSHELRTPLNAIIGFNELTLDETTGQLNAIQRGNLERVNRNAHNLLVLINNILDMSKIDAGHMLLLDEDVFLDEVVQSAVGNIETLLAAKNLRLVVKRDEGRTPRFRGDAGRLQQILINLLSNAVKFTPQYGSLTIALEWGIPAHFQVAASPSEPLSDEQWIALSVSDCGVGIEPQELDRIWSEFYQVDGSATRQYGGTGLGLAIVKRLTLLMGGKVAVVSQLGLGSTFSVWLPQQHHTEAIPQRQPNQTPLLHDEETTRW